MDDIARELEVNDHTSSGTRYAELDFFEYCCPGSPAFTAHDWLDNSSNVQNTNNFQSIGSPNYNNQNLYGCLWVPQAKNAGTGIIHWYFNRTLISAANVSYSSTTQSAQAGSGAFTGVFYDLETSAGYRLMFGGGKGGAMNVDYVMVWQ